MAFFKYEEKDIYYEEYGQGDPLVVLNGVMMNCKSWAEFIEPFSANNHLILLDMLDQGRSAKMDGPFHCKIQVEVLRALLDYLNLDKVNLVGISYGTIIGQQFAIKYGDRVKRMVLFNGTARTSVWLRDIGNAWNAAAGDADAYYLTSIPVIYSPGFYRDHNDWMEARRKALIPVFSDKAFMDSMIRLTNSIVGYDVVDQLEKIQAPTLVVSSGEDYLVPVEEQRCIVEHIPNVDYVVIPGCGHCSVYEKPVLFTTLTLGFIQNTKTEFNIVS